MPGPTPARTWSPMRDQALLAAVAQLVTAVALLSTQAAAEPGPLFLPAAAITVNFTTPFANVSVLQQPNGDVAVVVPKSALDSANFTEWLKNVSNAFGAGSMPGGLFGLNSPSPTTAAPFAAGNSTTPKPAGNNSSSSSNDNGGVLVVDPPFKPPSVLATINTTAGWQNVSVSANQTVLMVSPNGTIVGNSSTIGLPAAVGNFSALGNLTLASGSQNITLLSPIGVTSNVSFPISTGSANNKPPSLPLTNMTASSNWTSGFSNASNPGQWLNTSAGFNWTSMTWTGNGWNATQLSWPSNMTFTGMNWTTGPWNGAMTWTNTTLTGVNWFGNGSMQWQPFFDRGNNLTWLTTTMQGFNSSGSMNITWPNWTNGAFVTPLGPWQNMSSQNFTNNVIFGSFLPPMQNMTGQNASNGINWSFPLAWPNSTNATWPTGPWNNSSNPWTNATWMNGTGGVLTWPNGTFMNWTTPNWATPMIFNNSSVMMPMTWINSNSSNSSGLPINGTWMLGTPWGNGTGNASFAWPYVLWGPNTTSPAGNIIWVVQNSTTNGASNFTWQNNGNMTATTSTMRPFPVNGSTLVTLPQATSPQMVPGTPGPSLTSTTFAPSGPNFTTPSGPNGTMPSTSSPLTMPGTVTTSRSGPLFSTLLPVRDNGTMSSAVGALNSTLPPLMSTVTQGTQAPFSNSSIPTGSPPGSANPTPTTTSRVNGTTSSLIGALNSTLSPLMSTLTQGTQAPFFNSSIPTGSYPGSASPTPTMTSTSRPPFTANATFVSPSGTSSSGPKPTESPLQPQQSQNLIQLPGVSDSVPTMIESIMNMVTQLTNINRILNPWQQRVRNRLWNNVVGDSQWQPGSSLNGRMVSMSSASGGGWNGYTQGNPHYNNFGKQVQALPAMCDCHQAFHGMGVDSSFKERRSAIFQQCLEELEKLTGRVQYPPGAFSKAGKSRVRSPRHADPRGSRRASSMRTLNSEYGNFGKESNPADYGNMHGLNGCYAEVGDFLKTYEAHKDWLESLEPTAARYVVQCYGGNMGWIKSFNGEVNTQLIAVMIDQSTVQSPLLKRSLISAATRDCASLRFDLRAYFECIWQPCMDVSNHN